MPDLLEQWAGSRSVARAYGRAGLPMEVIQFPETWIPVDAIPSLFEISTRAAGDRCFGLHVGKDMTHKTFGLWMKYSVQAATLRDGLIRANQSSRFQQTGGKVVFVPWAQVSYRDLLNRAKRVRTQELLADTDMTVIDIALSLGYSDHGNFSRAFRKMTGGAPSDFRAMHLRGHESTKQA